MPGRVTLHVWYGTQCCPRVLPWKATPYGHVSLSIDLSPDALIRQRPGLEGAEKLYISWHGQNHFKTWDQVAGGFGRSDRDIYTRGQGFLEHRFLIADNLQAYEINNVIRELHRLVRSHSTNETVNYILYNLDGIPTALPNVKHPISFSTCQIPFLLCGDSHNCTTLLVELLLKSDLLDPEHKAALKTIGKGNKAFLSLAAFGYIFNAATLAVSLGYLVDICHSCSLNNSAHTAVIATAIAGIIANSLSLFFGLCCLTHSYHSVGKGNFRPLNKITSYRNKFAAINFATTILGAALSTITLAVHFHANGKPDFDLGNLKIIAGTSVSTFIVCCLMQSCCAARYDTVNCMIRPAGIGMLFDEYREPSENDHFADTHRGRGYTRLREVEHFNGAVIT